MNNPIDSQLFTDILVFLIRKWWVFLIVAILGGILGIYYASCQKYKYESKLTFALNGNEGGLAGAFNLAAQYKRLNLGGNQELFSGDNIMSIIKSRRAIDKVFLSTDIFENKPYTLIEYYWKKEGGKDKNDTLNFPPGITEYLLSDRHRLVLYNLYSKFLLKNLIVDRPDRRLGVFEVNITSQNEKFTKVFTDRLVAETNTFYTEVTAKKTKETMEVLEKQISIMKENLHSSLSNRAKVQDINLNPIFSMAQVPVLKQQANIQIYGAAYVELEKNLELARFEYLKQAPLMQIIDPCEYPMKRIRLGKIATGFWVGFLGDFLLLILLIFTKTLSYSRTSKGCDSLYQAAF